jgi:hypothetical protein
VRAALAALALYSVAADEDDDDDGGPNLQVFVDMNPSINSTDLSGCPAGTFAEASDDLEEDCTVCPKGRTTEVWSLEPTGALGCTVPSDDEDGEDSDDWVPSLAACKSTCVGTCPGIVWTDPAGPTSCLKCTAETEWIVPSGPLVQVHKRVAAGAPEARHCGFCTDGLTLVDGECEKTGVCSTIGPVPYFKASGTCLPCPPQDDVGTGLQVVVVLLLVAAAGGGIWLTSAFEELVPEEANDAVKAASEGAQDVGTVVAPLASPLVESVGILLPTFQFIATAFSIDFSWPPFVRAIGEFMKTVMVGSFTDVAAPECMFSYGASPDDTKYLSVLGLKFGVFLLYALIFGIIAVATSSDRAVCALATSYSVFLVLIASACFTAIDVVELPNGNYALKTLPSITSQTDDFFAMVGYGVFGLLLFLCVLPCLLFVQLKKASDAGTLWSPETQARFGSLFTKYRADCWWYEFTLMGRKILLAAIAILASNAIAALLLSAIIIVASIATHMKYKPFPSTPHRLSLGDNGTATHGEDTDTFSSTGDKLEVLCMCALLFVYLLGGISAAMEPEDGTGAATFIGILAVLVLIFPFAGAFFINNQAGSAGDDKAAARDGDGKSEEFVNPESFGKDK